MKPTPQISSKEQATRSFPLTDYAFQATAEAPTTSVVDLPSTKSRAFYQLSGEFFGAEANRHYAAELFFFALITAVAAWPILSMLACLAWMKIVI
jgi:hypothetical protein